MLKNINDKIVFVALYLIVLFIQYLYLGKIFTNPNTTIFAFGGDPYLIYYNLLSHTCWGEGLQLSGMNYPWGEYIFMTDGMAVFAILFNFLDGLGLPFCEYGIGLLHWTVIALLPFTAIFIYAIFRRLQVNQIVAIVASLLICFLSPQIVRFTAHFGLAFPFLIPACLWWFLKIYQSKQWTNYGFLVGAMILFFGLNNPYLGFICCAFLGLSLFFKFLMDRDLHFFWKNVLVPVIPLAALWIILKMGDPFDDRIEQQWGYFHYFADFKGLFSGEVSLFNQLFERSFEISDVSMESKVNIGLVASVSIIVMFLLGFIKRAYLPKTIRFLLPSLLACVVMFLYGAHFFIDDTYHDFIEDRLGFLTMFKSAARFLWPSFYVLTILAVLGIDKLIKHSVQRSVLFGSILAVFIFGTWFYETKGFIEHTYKNEVYGNVFSELRPDMQKIVGDNQITKDNYQAIYVLPKMQSWNDKLYVDDRFFSSHFGIKLSFFTQIPLINAKLSRMSMRQTILSQQFSAPELVERELLQYLDISKPVLLIVSNSDSLNSGEAYLKDQSRLLGKTEKISLYHLDLNQLMTSTKRDRVLASYEKIKENHFLSNKFPIFHDGFDKTDHKVEGLYGYATELKKCDDVLWKEIDLRDMRSSQKHQLSMFVFVDSKKHGLPYWKFKFLDERGKLLKEVHKSSRHGIVFHQNWTRIDQEFHMKPEYAKLEIFAKANQSFLIDELLVSEVQDSVFYKLESESSFMFNNYLIKTN